ncbi:MAG: HesA/MoeB/ThiF family protein [Desulfobacterales bacterium]|nr:HesA/MoeB/ThiF family protein [Desulfobacterales bacterium]
MTTDPIDPIDPIDPGERYARNFNTLSRADQEKLGQAHVAVIGLGGLGGGVCEFLARTGVGRLTLVDGDCFDATNLNRQLLSREDVLGNSKAEEAGKRVGLINSGVEVSVHHAFIREDNLADLLEGTDLVVDCLDTIHSRFLLQDAAGSLNIPLVSGAIAGVTGQVTVIFPGDRGFELIYGRPETSGDDPGRGIETRTGNISFCAGFTASLQASETLKILLGKGEVLRNKLLIADLWTNTVEVMDLI